MPESIGQRSKITRASFEYFQTPRKTWGKLYAKHEAKGFNMDVMDSLIAASAHVHQLTVVTRNTSDFPSDVKTVNPWIA